MTWTKVLAHPIGSPPAAPGRMVSKDANIMDITYSCIVAQAKGGRAIFNQLTSAEDIGVLPAPLVQPALS